MTTARKRGAAKKTVAMTPSAYRRSRVVKGEKRVDLFLNREARLALNKLTDGGVPQTMAINRAIIEAAARRKK